MSDLALKRENTRPLLPYPMLATASFQPDSRIHEAAYAGKYKLLKTLIKSGGVVQTKRHGFTALHQASCQGHLQCVRVLVDNGHELDVSSTKGITSLHLASAEGFLRVVKSLIDRGADKQLKDDKGFNCLHWATLRNRLQVMKYLVKEGVHFNSVPRVENKSSKTCRSNVDVARYLKQKSKARAKYTQVALLNILAAHLPSEISNCIMEYIRPKEFWAQLKGQRSGTIGSAEARTLLSHSLVSEIFEFAA